jgi:heme oxygenase
MPSQETIRKALQDATAPVHQRLHHHPGLAAVASGTISKEDYICLLMRLYGFHRPFDDRVCAAGSVFETGLDLDIRKRAVHIAQDLKTLGADETALASLPLCVDIQSPRSPGELLGALYVVEGSTLGGRMLARALSSLFGQDAMDGRRFFYGYGERHGVMWRDFVTRLEANAATRDQQIEILNGATKTFHIFEVWMKEWRLQPIHQSDRASESRISSAAI